ncbi:peptidase [Clostridium sp. KNHs216]|uniref:phage major capsid protein n=1 Tax=Clostridium sp. KNHs216 TaxID=1550235 RepID=UPI0011546555|nr:peptidase [Clostridium sp. KNHs216]
MIHNNNLLTRAASGNGGGELRLQSRALECRAVEDQENQYEISFSSETPYVRWGIPEILSHDADAVDLSCFTEGGTGVLLFNHGSDLAYGKVPIGKVVKAWLDEAQHKCRAIIEMDADDPQAARLQGKLDKGMLTGVSVGYTVGAWMELQTGQKSPDGRFIGPANVAVKWTPMEISLAPVPADTTVGLGRNINSEEEHRMGEDNNTNPVSAGGAAVPSVEPTATRSLTGTQPGGAPAPTAPVAAPVTSPNLIEAERQRSAEITVLCRSFQMEDRAAGYISSGTELDAVRAEILTALQQRNAPLPVGAEPTNVGVTRDEMDKVRAAAADGMLMRSGISIEKPAEGANEFRGMSIKDVAVECLMRFGDSKAHRLSNEELFRRSMTPDSAFVSIADDVANRTVLSAQQTAPTTFQGWTSKASQPDFRPTHVYEVSDGGELEEIPQNGEFKEAKLGDEPVATRRLITVGKMLTFTRQMFINDDFNQITRFLTAYTLAFARGINKSVYEILLQNPAMQDGQQLFSNAHKNLGTGAVPGTASFSEARKLMRQQTDMDGKTKLNVAPAYVLTGSTTETSIEALLASLADPSSANSGVANVFRNKMQMITDAELDVDSGAQPYFFSANPALTPTIEVSYLNGAEAPTVESEVSFDHLGIRYRVYGDRGITLLGYRGLVKNPGMA